MRTLLSIIFVTALIFFSAPIYAQENVTKVKPTDITITSIYASKTAEGVDASLENLKSKLQRGFRDYSTFKQLKQTTLNLTPDTQGNALLPNGTTLKMTYLEGSEKYVKLKFEISGKISTKVKVARGSTFFQAGLNYNDGILILAISVK